MEETAVAAGRGTNLSLLMTQPTVTHGAGKTGRNRVLLLCFLGRTREKLTVSVYTNGGRVLL